VVGIACAGANGASGTIYNRQPPAQYADATLGFSACRTGGIATTVACASNALSLFGTSYSAPILSGHADQASGATTICAAAVPAIPGCTIRLTATGGAGRTAMSVSWNNVLVHPTFTFAVSGQTMTAAWSSCSGLFPTASGSAAATLSTTAGTALVYTVTSPNPTPWTI
jgi:hypothetical protein